MITRVWTSDVKAERLNELIDWIEVNSWPLVQQAPGFDGGTLYVPLESGDRIVTVSNWADAASLANFAGEDWKEVPIVYDEERPFLSGSVSLRHYVPRQIVTPERIDTRRG